MSRSERLRKKPKKSAKKKVDQCCTVNHLVIETKNNVEGGQHCCPLTIERFYWALKDKFQSDDYFDVAVNEVKNFMPCCDAPYDKSSRRVLRILVRMIMSQNMLRDSTVEGGISWLDREERANVREPVLGRRSIYETVYNTRPATFAKFMLSNSEHMCTCDRALSFREWYAWFLCCLRSLHLDCFVTALYSIKGGGWKCPCCGKENQAPRGLPRLFFRQTANNLGPHIFTPTLTGIGVMAHICAKS